MTLDLCHLPKPAKTVGGVGPAQVPEMMGNGTSNNVTISFLDDHSTSVNLFEAKRVYGFFPFTTVEDGITTIAVSTWLADSLCLSLLIIAVYLNSWSGSCYIIEPVADPRVGRQLVTCP